MAIQPLVLVIEDDPDSRAYLSAVIEDNGYRVQVLGDDEALSEVLTRARPAVVILDMLQPSRSGGGLYRQLRTDPEFGTIPVIMVSGLEARVVWEALAHDTPPLPMPDRIVEKPISPAELTAMVAALVPADQGKEADESNV